MPPGALALRAPGEGLKPLRSDGGRRPMDGSGEVWDVIIAGAGFAGLATAAEVHARKLLLDRFPVGGHQVSACATFVRVMEEFGCGSAILRTFDSIVLHMPRPLRVPLVEPLCTFDFGRLCRTLMARAQAEFLRTTVRGLEGDAVVTDAGRLRGRYLVDATGWAGALTNGAFRRGRRLAFGIEVDTDWDDGDLHLFVDPRLVRWGYGWAFPTAGGSRVGVGSYDTAQGLRASLAALLRRLGTEGGKPHGGPIPWDLRGGVHGRVFLVGDSAGVALPVTLEGIRRSLEAGRRCGRLLDEVVHGRLGLGEALRRHDAEVRRARRAYRLLGLLQGSICRPLDPLMRYLTRPRGLQRLYLRV